MQAKYLSVSIARNLNGTPVNKIDGATAEALAIVQEVGFGAAKSQAGKSAWSIVATNGIAIQTEFLPLRADNSEAGVELAKQKEDGLITEDECKAEIAVLQAAEDEAANEKRIKALDEHKRDVIAAIRSEAVSGMAKAAGWDKGVTSIKRKDGSTTDSLTSLMARATKALDAYYKAIAGAWTLGVSIEYQTLTNGTIIPESRGKLAERVAKAKAKAEPITPSKIIASAFGSLSSDVQEAAKDCNSAKIAEAMASLATTIKALSFTVIAGKTTPEDVSLMVQEIQAAFLVGGTEDAPLAEIPPEGEENAPRESEAAVG